MGWPRQWLVSVTLSLLSVAASGARPGAGWSGGWWRGRGRIRSRAAWLDLVVPCPRLTGLPDRPRGLLQPQIRPARRGTRATPPPRRAGCGPPDRAARPGLRGRSGSPGRCRHLRRSTTPTAGARPAAPSQSSSRSSLPLGGWYPLHVDRPQRRDLDLAARVNPVDAGDLPDLAPDLMSAVVHDPAHCVVDQLEQVVHVAAPLVWQPEPEPDLDRADQDRLASRLRGHEGPGRLLRMAVLSGEG